MKYRMTFSEFFRKKFMMRDKKEFSASSDKKACEKARNRMEKMTDNNSMEKTYKLVGLVKIIRPATKEKIKKVPLS